MAGKKGRSGRKARTDGITMRAVALYIPMTKYQDIEGKDRFRPESWFMQFKRVFGSQWQEQENNMWQCDCNFTIKRYHFRSDFQCKRCGAWKSQQARRVMGDLE
jgi:hypothetical protein